jgi:acyl dehydratase
MTIPKRTFITGNMGRWIEGVAVKADAVRAEAFASAIEAPADDRNLTAATPMFNIVPIYSCLFEAVDLVTPEDLRSSVVHGSHDIRFHRPVAIGSVLSARARVVDIHAVPVGTAVTVQVAVVDETGTCTSSQWATALVRGGVIEQDDAIADARVPAAETGSPKPEPTIEPMKTVTVLHSDQTRRFSSASGDMNAVHLDDELARGLGFDGVILHGLCTMGIASVAAIDNCCNGDAGRIARLAVRFAAPAYPTGELTTEFQSLGNLRYSFETTTSAGVAVIRRGIAEISPEA